MRPTRRVRNSVGGGQGYTWLKTNGWKWGFRNTFVYRQWGESHHWDFEGIN